MVQEQKYEKIFMTKSLSTINISVCTISIMQTFQRNTLIYTVDTLKVMHISIGGGGRRETG